MDVFEAIRTNLAIRSYLDKPVPENIIKKILEAGRLAHSSKNTQPWRFIIVRDRRKLEEISKTTPTGAHIANAAFAIALFTENAKLPEVDGSRAMEDMMLVAWSEGVGSCWVTNFDEKKVKEILKVPDHLKLITVAPFGYPDRPRPKGKKRRTSLNEIAFEEEYGKPLRF